MICIAVLNDLIVNGSARFLNKLYANDIDIGGTATFANLATTGNATIGGTLGVTGATTQTGKLTVNNVIEQHGNGIELYYSTPHIDFHHSNSTADFTSRIIENDSGILTITPKFSTPNATITTGNITTLNTNTISNAGAIVTRDMEVVDTLKSYKWDISHVANLANDFTVSPTLQLASGATIQFSAINTSTKVCTFTVTDSSSISSDSLGGVTWTQYSKVKFTMNLNDVVNSNCDGYLTVKMNSTAGTLVISGTLDDVTGLATGTNYNAEGATIMLYEVGAGSQSTTYPVGIRMTAYGSNKRSYIDIYGGTATSSWNTPHLRIGNVGGLTFNGSTLENQWGIYTDRGYFSGAIVSTEGKIGGFDIDGTKLYSNGHSTYNTATSGVYIGTDYISFGNGGVTYFKDDGTGKIGKWTVGANDLYNGTIGSTTSALVSIGTNSSANIGGSGATSHTWSFTAGSKFGVTSTGDLYCNSANVQGKIDATSGTIGGWSIGTDTNKSLYYGGTTPSATNLVLSKGTVASSTSVGGSTGSLSWMILAGNKFGVTTGGVLYASEANISGAVNATSLNVGSASSSNHLIYNSTTGIIDLSTDWLKFVNNAVIIGKDNESHISIDYHSFTMQDSEDEFFRVEDKRNSQGIATITDTSPVIEKYNSWQSSSQYKTIVTDCYPEEINSVIIQNAEDSTQTTDVTEDDNVYTQNTTYLNNLRFDRSNLPYTKNIIKIEYTTTEKAISFTFGSRNSSKNVGKISFASGSEVIASGSFSHVEGGLSEASGSYSHAEGTLTSASGQSSHAEGDATKAAGVYSHAEGSEVEAMGQASHAEGYKTIAYGSYSHAEGNISQAFGESSHAQGDSCWANADASFATGIQSAADGEASNALGEGAYATKKAQTVIGTWCNEDTSTTTTHSSHNTDYGTYALIVGNGEAYNTKSNALTVDWNGVASHYGDVTQSNIRSAITNLIVATNSGATIPTVSFTKKGNVAMLHMTIKSTGAIGGGSNIFQATLAAKYRPAQYTTGVGYYGNHPIIGRITDDGAVLVRNVSTSNVTLTDSVEVAFTYILKDYFV